MDDMFADREKESVKKIALKTKGGYDHDNDFVVFRDPRDPHPFWRIKRERGQTPESLSGLYTSLAKAEEAVAHYVNSKGQSVK